jgi:ATP-dependent RNA helicase RhlB
MEKHSEEKAIPEEPQLQETIQRAEQPAFLTLTNFEDFELPPAVQAGLKDAGFIFCTPIQAEILPAALAGRDVAGQAQTGTGKTAAFLVPLFTRLMALTGKETGVPSALIVAPTRELAVQIYEDARLLGGHTGLTLALVVGGIDYRQQAEALRQGPDIVICTPGRIIDYIKQGIFKTTGIRVLVIDEADRLFDLGFVRDMRYILRRLPHYEKRLSMLFSATLSYRVLALTYDFMNLPEFISVTPAEITVEGVEQSLFHVGSNEKVSLLLGLLKREEWSRVLIFVNTRAGVEWLTRTLKRNGLPAEGITGDLPQPKRLDLMKRFKEGRIKILVATDVASRGIHVEDISHVINFDLPQDPENYIHRIGRTARAGKPGRAISLACEEFVFHLQPIEEKLGYKIPVVWPEESWFLQGKSGSLPTKPKSRPSGPRPRPSEPRPGPSEARPRPPEARPGPPKPARPEDQGLEERRVPRSKGPGKIVFSNQPGGVFGLAPERSAETPDQGVDQKKGHRKKPRRRRPRKTVQSQEQAPTSSAQP